MESNTVYLGDYHENYLGVYHEPILESTIKSSCYR